MEFLEKKKTDFLSFIRRKISEKEAELRQRKYSQFQIQAKAYDLNPIEDLNFLYQVGKASFSIFSLINSLI